MPRVTDNDYEQLAEDIVSAFIDEGTPLDESIYKKASDMGLLPDQIRQLSWRSNVKAHLDLFKKKAEDKIIEFPLADAAKVIERIYSGEEEQTKTASDKAELATVVDFYGSFESTTTTIEKTAGCATKTDDKRGRRWLDKEPDLTKRNEDAEKKVKTAEALITQGILNEREYYIDALNDLASDLRKLAHYPEGQTEINEFVHEAVSVYDPSIEYILEDLGLKPTEEMKKVATIGDTSTKLHQKLSLAKNHFDAAKKASISLGILRKKAKLLDRG